jgi:hypothetical protein
VPRAGAPRQGEERRHPDGHPGPRQPGHYLIREWIAGGGIGELQSIEPGAASPTTGGHAGWSTLLGSKPEKGEPVPATLNWDLFLGPAPAATTTPPTTRPSGAPGGTSATA